MLRNTTELKQAIKKQLSRYCTNEYNSEIIDQMIAEGLKDGERIKTSNTSFLEINGNMYTQYFERNETLIYTLTEEMKLAILAVKILNAINSQITDYPKMKRETTTMETPYKSEEIRRHLTFELMQWDKGLEKDYYPNPKSKGMRKAWKQCYKELLRIIHSENITLDIIDVVKKWKLEGEKLRDTENDYRNGMGIQYRYRANKISNLLLFA